MKLKGCENVWVGKSLLVQCEWSTYSGNGPWCTLFPAQVLSGRLLTVPGQNCKRNHSNQKFHCSGSPQAVLFSTAVSAWKYMSILVTFTLLHPTFSDLFSIHWLFKTVLSKCTFKNYVHTPLPSTSPFPELKHSAMKQLILTFTHH